MPQVKTRGYYIHEVSQKIEEAWEEGNETIYPIINALEEWLFDALKHKEWEYPNLWNFFANQKPAIREGQFVNIQQTIQPMKEQEATLFSIDDQASRRRNTQKALLEIVLNEKVLNDKVIQLAEALKL